jgi:hypothetical protein
MSVFQDTSVHEGIQNFDLGGIGGTDPSVVDGYTVIYEREVPLEIRHQQENEEVGPGVMETLRIKILVQGETPGTVRSLRVEFSSEADLFFQYVHELDEEGMIKYSDYEYMLLRYQLVALHFYNIY